MPISVRATPIRDETGRVAGAVEVTCNTRGVAMTALNKEFRTLSLLDPLSEVGNRRFLEPHLMAGLNGQDGRMQSRNHRRSPEARLMDPAPLYIDREYQIRRVPIPAAL